MDDLKNDIEKYLRGELSPADRHALEKRALTDPFLADALDGAESISAEDFSADLQSLQEDLNKRLPKNDAKVVDFWTWPMRIAAGLAILAVTTYVIYQNTDHTTDQRLAQSDEEVKIVPEESSRKDNYNYSSADSVVAEEIPSISPQPSTSLSRQEAKPSTKPEKEYLALNKTEVEEITPIESPAPVEAPKPELSPASGVAAYYDKADDVVQEEDKTSVNGFLSEDKSKKAVSQSPAPDSKKQLKARKAVEDKNADVAQTRSAIVVATKVINGKVTDAEDGTGLPGVNVSIKGTDIGTVTDSEGNYEIPVEANVEDLVFSFIGMENQEVAIGDAKEVNVALNPDMTQLSEVVVVGYGNESLEEIKGRITFATPAGGRGAFKQYIESTMRYPEQALENNVEGRVTVQFTVETSGDLTNFKVVKGIGSGCDEEVIRLIKEGPKWNPTRKQDEPITGKMKVRVRFKLPKKK